MKHCIILFYVPICILLSSCSIIAGIPQEYETDNVYKTLNMDCFKGFVDKMSVEELLSLYGKPDTILDAEKVAATKGYDIYEYSFSDGNIDCYVMKGGDKKRSIVDYIYYEPKASFKLVDFLYSDSLYEVIQDATTEVYYISDEFNNFVRIRLSNDNREEIVNVALNDVSELDVKERVSTSLKELRQQLPVSLGDFGSISRMEIVDKEMQVYIMVNDCSYLNLQTIVKKNPNWPTILATFLFDDFGILKGKTSDIIRERLNIKFCLYGNYSNEKEESVLYSRKFRELFKYGISNEERILNYVAFENLTLPYIVNERLALDKMKVENKKLIVPIILKGSKEEYKEMIDKEHNTDLLSDKNNPERQEISLCTRCNYGYRKIYFICSDEKTDTVVINYSPEELKKVRKRF